MGLWSLPCSAPRSGGLAVDIETGRVKLTDLASCGGCAAKYSAARLEELLAGFVPVEAENLLVGLAPADDAAVYRLDDERALIFTLDFFPPVVDDPSDYGAIAATNALNDVFAMGGTPLLALSIAAFPEELPMEMLAEIFAAADAQVRAAGGLLAGGHTIRDAEPKYGLAVVGTVHPKGIWPKNGARPGDALFLTKPLGTGLIMTGYKRGDPRNRDFAGAHVELDGISDTLVALGYDPQTAGGLLVSVAGERAAALEAEFTSRRLFIRRIGRVEEGAGVVVE